MDGRNPLVTGYYRKRVDAIVKCASVALRFGYKCYAVQHQGWCATGPKACATYKKYGRSNRCRNGKGGPWANDVYVLRGKDVFYYFCFRLEVKSERAPNFFLCACFFLVSLFVCLLFAVALSANYL